MPCEVLVLYYSRYGAVRQMAQLVARSNEMESETRRLADVPRLAVGVWATTTGTPLFFAQAVGRFVRARRRGELASVFVPTVPPLLRHAAEMELERNHVMPPPRRVL